MKFSIGLLSWKRVSNIRQIVDEYIFHDDLIDEIIIWNNNFLLIGLFFGGHYIFGRVTKSYSGNNYKQQKN